MPTREHMRISGNTLDEVITNMNFYLQRINQRLDQLEGWLGTPTFQADIDLQSNKITGLGLATESTDGLRKDQRPDGLDTTDTVTFDSITVNSITVNGDADIDEDIESDSITIKDLNDTIIHQFGQQT